MFYPVDSIWDRKPLGFLFRGGVYRGEEGFLCVSTNSFLSFTLLRPSSSRTCALLPRCLVVPLGRSCVDCFGCSTCGAVLPSALGGEGGFLWLHGTKSAVAPARPQLLQSCLVRVIHGCVVDKGKRSLEMAPEGHGCCQHSLNQMVRRVKVTT